MTGKSIFIVHAHPEPRSLNAALKDLAVRTLSAAGHHVEVSDLYAMGWKAAADGADFPRRDPAERLHYGRASRAAFDAGAQADEVRAEQDKLLRADAVILQFPLWWFSVPAILKGWVDRVFANGFAYGVGLGEGKRYGARYGEGTLAGKRALVALTAGGQPGHFSTRGVNGHLEDLLFPLTHGTLYYTGMQVLRPFAVFGANRFSDEQYAAAAAAYTVRLGGLFDEAPIPFRSQNGPDYDDELQLRPGLEENRAGPAIHEATHQAAPGRTVATPATPERAAATPAVLGLSMATPAATDQATTSPAMPGSSA